MWGIELNAVRNKNHLISRTKTLARLPGRHGIVHQLLVLFASVVSPCLHAATPGHEQLMRLEVQYQDFSRLYYRELIGSSIFPLQRLDNIHSLKEQTDSLFKDNKPVEAIAWIHYNRKLIKTNIDTIETVSVVTRLLQYNDWHEAGDIMQTAKSFAGKTAVANISFEFARYFMQRKEWQQTMRYLDDIINDLSVENASYARIMIGTMLQYQRKHRQAIEYYTKVPSSSTHYATAILNTAVAYIRQDWWTDAQVLIEDTLRNHRGSITDEMADRLNLVLGYALLRKNYFRNSRDYFRNISLQSPYTNRALLGLALTAANQDDFIGALNAITLLKEKKTTELAVDEAYLLLPYTYGKLKQHLTASSAYTDAIKYYQGRIADLNGIIGIQNSLTPIIQINTTRNQLQVKGNDLDFNDHYPGSFFINFVHLRELEKYITSLPAIHDKYRILQAEYNNAMSEVARFLISERIEHLQSYLNQARYGLARLYDSNLTSAN